MYKQYLDDASTVINHCKTVVSACDPILQQKYAGFICVFSIATYELAIKNILFNFCNNKHPIFGNFIASKFEKINAKVDIDRLNSDFLKHLGQKYTDNFKYLIDSEERFLLKNKGISLKSSYHNLITWRHSFAHSGSIPNTATFNEVCNNYEIGLSVIYCFDIALAYD